MEEKRMDWTGKLKFRKGDWLSIGLLAVSIAMGLVTGTVAAGTVQGLRAEKYC